MVGKSIGGSRDTGLIKGKNVTTRGSNTCFIGRCQGWVRGRSLTVGVCPQTYGEGAASRSGGCGGPEMMLPCPGGVTLQHRRETLGQTSEGQ